jgi:AbrB family looped-hinge helix DNA binding protein
MAKAASATTRVSTKGQVILPKAVRVKRNWSAGTELVVEDTPDGVLLKAAPIFPPTKFEDVAGILRRGSGAGRALTVEEMDEAIQAEARRRARD